MLESPGARKHTVRNEEIGKLAGNSRRKPKGTPETIREITNNKKDTKTTNKGKTQKQQNKK